MRFTALAYPFTAAQLELVQTMFRHISNLPIDDFGLRWLFHLYFGRTEHYGYLWRLIGSCDSRPDSLRSWLWTGPHGMKGSFHT